MSDSKQKGEKTEAIVLAELMKRNLTVLQPFGENQRYDFVIETGGEFYALQCKTARREGGKAIFRTRSVRPSSEGYIRKDYGKEIDYFVVYCPANEETYLVSGDEASKNEMTLRIEPPGNNQSKGINWAEEYSIDAKLSELEGT
jgi:hypothetical protein